MLATCSALERLPLDVESKALLEQAGDLDELRLLKLLQPHFTVVIKAIDLGVVRALQELARGLGKAGESGLSLFNQVWLLARLSELFASRNLLPFCSRCYRTVAMRRDGRPKEFCPEHASDNESTNRGGYLRGYRFSTEFVERVSSEEFENQVTELEYRFLRHQYYSTRYGAGAASYVVCPEEVTEPIWTKGTALTIEGLRLNEICDDYPDWTELTLRWRKLFNDEEGVQELLAQDRAITPRVLVTQWLRWKAWSDLGDKTARVGKGRPAKIDKDTALKLKADGKTYAEIAEIFGVSKVAVGMFFTRLKKKSLSVDI